jgi:hypothetical protein
MASKVGIGTERRVQASTADTLASCTPPLQHLVPLACAGTPMHQDHILDVTL